MFSFNGGKNIFFIDIVNKSLENYIFKVAALLILYKRIYRQPEIFFLHNILSKFSLLILKTIWMNE